MSEAEKDFAEEVRTITAYKREAESARLDRMALNLRNWDFYHLKQDFSHKKTGQSQEFLPKVAMAVEQTVSYVHQGLIDLGEWFSVDPEPGNKEPLVTRDQARALLSRQLEKAQFFTFIQDALKSGLLEAIMIAKVHGRMVERPVFFTEKTPSGQIALKRRKNQAWELRIDQIRARDYFPDPTTRKLYQIQSIEMDLWEIIEIAEEHPDVYDIEAINGLSTYLDGELERTLKEREADQTPSDGSYRKRIVIDEVWGSVISSDGKTVLHRNSVCSVAGGQFMIRRPEANPNWHGKSPIVTSPIIRVPHSEWHKALMDAPASLNQAQNELYNLILDAGIMEVFGVRQVREDWIDNADEMSNGIAPGFVAKANASCPPGAKVMETVSTSVLGSGALQVLNLTNAELQASALSSDLRQGVLPSRAVKATEVVESSQSITSVFTGIAKTIEESFIEKILDLAWLTMWQNADDWDDAEVKAILGEAKAQEIKNMSPEQRFEKVVNGHKFKVFGITQTLNKIKDFRKLTSLLQTISGSQILLEEFSKQNDVSKLLNEIIKSLDINVDKIKQDEADSVMTQMGQQDQGGDAGGAPQGNAPDAQSQIPQAAAGGNGPDLSSLSALPTTQFSGRSFNGG